MKVCMVLLNLGSIRHDARVRKEASSLAQAGHQVRLVAMRHPGEEFEPVLDGFELSLFPLKSRGLARNFLAWPLKYLEFNIKAVARMVRFRAHAYHAHDLDTLPTAWLAAKLTGAKLVYDAHELYTERPVQAAGFWRRVERFLIKRADAVIAANEDRAEVMFNEYGAREMPVAILNCPSPKTGPVSGNLTVRDRLPEHAKAKRIVLYQGALSPNRCLESLTLSAKYLDDRAVLVFVGNPSSFSETVLKGLTKEHSLEEKVFFADPVDSRELVRYISSADIGVVIYKNSCRNNYLCAPNKLFDYGMAGLPSIGCDFPPVRRVAHEYGVTRLFDPEDPKSIADAANSFITDDAGYAAAKAATATVSAVFTWEHEAQKLADLYARLLKPTPPSK